jgi:TRAP-type C4-dicarboxylate transport system permease small subunit
MFRAIKIIDDWFEEFFCSLFLSALVLLLGVQVFERFVFSKSVSWHEEGCRFLFIWLVYLGVSLGVKRDEHIRIVVFIKFIPPAIRKYVSYISETGWLLFFLCVFYLSLPMMKVMFEYKHLSASLQWNMAYIYLIIPFSALLTSFRIVQSAYRRFKASKPPILLEE